MKKTSCFSLVMFFAFSVLFSFAEEDPRKKQAEKHAERKKLQNEAKTLFSMDYAEKLSSGEKKLEDWADELEKADPMTPSDMWTTYHVCLRAGRYETAEKMLPKLYAVIEPIEAWHFKAHEVFTPLRPSTDDHPLSPEMFRLQVRFYEVFGRLYGRANFGHAFRSACPWTPKEMLEWVKTRYFEAVEYDVKQPVDTSPILSPMGSSLRDFPSKAARDWQSHYFAQLQLIAHKREIEPEQYLDSIRNEWRRLAEGAKTDPGNLKKLLHFINAVERLGFVPDSDENTPDLKWLAENAEKRSGLEAMSLAEQFVRLGESRKIRYPDNRRTSQKEIDPAVETEIKLCYTAAEPFWRRALTAPPPRWTFDIPEKIYHLPLGTTKEEEQEMIEKMYRQAQEAHDSKLLQGLAKTLTALGRDEEAREMLDEGRRRNPMPAMEIRQKNDPQTDPPSYHTQLLRLKEENKVDEMAALFKEHDKPTEEMTAERLQFLDISAVAFVDTNQARLVFDRFLEEMQARIDNLDKNHGNKIQERSYLERLMDKLLLTQKNEKDYRRFIGFSTPIYRDVLNHTRIDSLVFRRLAEELLFPGEHNKKWSERAKNPTAVPEVLEFFREMAERPDIDTRFYMDIIGILAGKKAFTQAMPFIEKALAEAELRDTGRLHTFKMSMIRAATETGDWRRLEKYAEEVFQGNKQFLDQYLDRLRKAAELAEKAGAAEDAERLRKRIAEFDARK